MVTRSQSQPQRTARARLLRLLIRVALVLVALFLIVTFVVVPVGFGIAATNMPRETVGAPPPGFENVSLMTTDGDRLAGWYAPPHNGAVIVLAHGASGSREAVRAYAEMLTRHDFGVLAFDLRGHGESDGQTNLYGWQGTGDVSAAVAWLGEQSDVKAIGGIGLSMGGEVLLGAASANPSLTAIVSEGATHRSMAEFRAVPSHANPVVGLQPWIGYTVVGMITGDAPPTPILDSIEAATSTHFLLIAAADVADEVEFNRVFADAAPGRAEVWIVPDGGHIGGFTHYADEYERRVVDFFSATLLDG
ncbi:MAG: alpha/beta fold hydrolase [Anaerolineae bacterium]|nr:alpha/beta fold hydrolase [Anaerolineae bacterium]